MAEKHIGRPPVADEDKRRGHITLYLTKAEVALLRQRAGDAGLRPAVYCRKAAMGARLPSRVNRTAHRELSRIGNNLNQLAYHANATGRVAEWHELKSVLDAIRVKAKEL